MEEYLEKLLAQIRCKKARPYIAEEYGQWNDRSGSGKKCGCRYGKPG